VPAQATTATAYWTVAPGVGELRRQPLPPPGPGEVLVRTLHSGCSRGSELLVHRGGVPAAVAATMRAPFQEGDLPGPVKYGYLSVGVVEGLGAGAPPDLLGRTVFCLFPHQDRYVVPAAAVHPVPDGVPPRRAVLAGTVETALNALWDAAPRMGDRVAVVGAGMVGACVAALARRFPLERLQLVDVDPARAAVAAALNVDFALPEDALGGCDVVVHASASGAGLGRGLELLGDEGELVEVSWYGDRPVTVDLGAAFHARRLVVRASQVGAVAASRRARRTTAERLATALDLLRDPAFDALLSGPVALADLPRAVDDLASGRREALCLVVDHPAADAPRPRPDPRSPETPCTA
jgi:threonine dehydrogenase-like Zn-dependent dehydrogenase